MEDGAPAVGRHLDQAMGHQRRRDRQHERQDAHQHQAAGHAEHARDGGRYQGCEEDEGYGGKTHRAAT